MAGSAGVSITYYKQVQDDWVYGEAPINWYTSPTNSNPWSAIDEEGNNIYEA